MDALDIITIVCLVGIFIFGYFIVKHLDKFLIESKKHIEKVSETKEPSCIILTDSASDEELLEEIHKFRKQHKQIYIVLQDSTCHQLPHGSKNNSHQKQ